MQPGAWELDSDDESDNEWLDDIGQAVRIHLYHGPSEQNCSQWDSLWLSMYSFIHIFSIVWKTNYTGPQRVH